jgi:3-deoxy-D-manno-octulosonic-acid transferase
MYFTYTFLMSVGLLLASPYYFARFRKYLPTLTDRLGFTKLPSLDESIWVHAVSVGEVKAVEKLVERLRVAFPECPLIMSTATPTGQQLARQRKDAIDHAFYFPLDLPWCIKRVLDRANPRLVIIAETEIWPNFLRACRRRAVPVVMINGRISDRSFPRYKLVSWWLPRVFADYTMLGMQSETDRRRIEAIGASPEKVTVFGNLKYDVDGAESAPEPALAGFLRSWKRVWIAASTMPGEDEIVLEAYRGLREMFPDLKLLIAPRHPERSDDIRQAAQRLGMDCVARTAIGAASGEESVLLLDTIGELASLFSYASIVFVGGSLVPRGGHNILEPARHSKPIVIGPHMENFRDIERMFLKANAAIQIRSAGELASTIGKLLADRSLAARLGVNARRVVVDNAGATDRVIRFLSTGQTPRPVQPLGAAF